MWSCALSHVSSSLHPCGLQPVRLRCPWDSPCKNPGMGCHALLQGIFQTRDPAHVPYVSCIGRGFFTTSNTWEPPLLSTLHIYTAEYCTLLHALYAHFRGFFPRFIWSLWGFNTIHGQHYLTSTKAASMPISLCEEWAFWDTRKPKAETQLTTDPRYS